MEFLKSIVLGIIEGLTEFLPISSTFHLIFASQFLRIKADDFSKLFNVFIQSGAILAVLVLYFKNLKKDFALVKKTLVAFVPTLVLGVIAYKTIKQVFFESYYPMIAVFILVGVLFLVFEFLVKKKIIRPEKTISELSYREAALIGLVQAFSFLPGVSRSGAVILTMMVLGFRRDDSAYFSFILSIPTIFSAGLYDLFKTREALVTWSGSFFPLLVGFIISFIVAILAVKWFISYLQKHTLNLFAFYRLIAGFIILLSILILF